MTNLLAADRPSIGLRLMADTGLLAELSPELAAQRGVPQNKVEGEDLWDHTLRAVDGAVSEPARIRVAALLHDIAKPQTMADGRFLGHESVGAELADELLDAGAGRLRSGSGSWRWSASTCSDTSRLVGRGDRRFIAKIGPDHLEDLFLLREADHIGSGREPDAGGLDELRARVAAQLDAGVALDLRGLAVGGSDLMEELGVQPGPGLGRMLTGRWSASSPTPP